MQSAETVLDVLRERGRRGLPCDELYRQLFNPQLYLLAAPTAGRCEGRSSNVTMNRRCLAVLGAESELDVLLEVEAARRRRRRWCLRAGLDDAAFVGEDHGLDAVAQSEFHEDAADVAFDGRVGDDQALGDLVVGEAAGDEDQDLPLAWCELAQKRVGGLDGVASPRVVLDETAGDRG
jgi:hypothetical protein